MSIISRLRLLRRCRFSRPAADRPIYRTICRSHVQKIVELGVGDGRRALAMIDTAKLVRPDEQISYVGLDPFEDQSDQGQPTLTLKAAYQLLRPSGARVQLMPGNPPDSLVRMANSLGKVDLLIMPAELASLAFSRVWLFVPRMLHEQSLVFLQQPIEDGSAAIRLLEAAEIETLSAAGVARRAA